MYIRKIIINNITSLKGEHVIDFTREPLRSADLFAITGDTGAGKSTILDCICLALYNRAPRFALRERNVVAVAADNMERESETHGHIRLRNALACASGTEKEKLCSARGAKRNIASRGT